MKFFRALAKLWRFATCDHMNACTAVVFEDTTEINVCTRCGRVLWITDEGSRRHNPHLLRDRLDPRPKARA
jgi:hypothetical protein